MEYNNYFVGSGNSGNDKGLGKTYMGVSTPNSEQLIFHEYPATLLKMGNQYPEIMKKFNRYIEKKENDIILDKIQIKSY